MSISKSYKQTLRRRAVQRFVKENNRSPSNAELNQLIFEEESAYPTVDVVGISGFDIDTPRYSEPASSSKENANRVAMWDDAITLNTRLDELIEKMEDSHRGFYGTAKRIGRLLNKTDSRLSNILLLNEKSDAFLAGVEETFDSQESVNRSLSSATIESGYVTLGRTGYSQVDLSKVSFSASASGVGNILGTVATSPISSLKEDDGTIWEYIVYTKEQHTRTSVVMTFEFAEPAYIGDVRVNCLPVSGNKKMTTTCFYSLDGSSWATLEPVEQVVVPEMAYQVGVDKVKKLQLTFSKDAADSSSPNKNAYMHIYSFDSVKIYADKFEPSKRSALVCGPYSVTDDIGNAVNFTKATIEACTNEPEGTSVNFYLSQNGTDWFGVSHDGQSSKVVSFGDSTPTQSAGSVEASTAGTKLLPEVDGLFEIDFANEAVLNTYVDSAYVNLVPIKSFVIKRNVVTNTTPATLSTGIAPGWSFNKLRRLYETTVYIDDPNGRYLELGDTSAYLNGRLVSGKVFLPQGYTVFGTSESNYIEVNSGLLSAAALESEDPLYPYNHKYLIEGYNYADSFSGDEIYQGVNEYFGKLLTYRSPEEFAYFEPNDRGYYDAFTIENGNGNWYIKVKVNKSDSSWQEEQLSASWVVQSSGTNELYVKALMGTTNSGQTPKIDWFKVRVI